MSVDATLNICNARGLHARASGLLMLGAGIGCSIDVSAEGPDAEEAMEALTDLVARKFDEDQ